MQMDVHKSLYPLYSTRKYPVAGQQSQKCASLAAIARSIKIIYTGYLQIFKAGYFFSKKRGHGLYETTNYDFVLLNKTSGRGRGAPLAR